VGALLVVSRRFFCLLGGFVCMHAALGFG
jgi:hypothetical protein